MENIFVALTNLPVVYPITSALKNGDILTALAIGFVGIASIISHLAENHKHSMRGIGFSTRTSYLLNRMDVLGCAVTVSRLLYLYYTKHGVNNVMSGTDAGKLGLVLALNLVSEYDNQNKGLKPFYIVTHSLWHISVFLLMGDFYNKYLM